MLVGPPAVKAPTRAVEAEQQECWTRVVLCGTRYLRAPAPPSPGGPGPQPSSNRFGRVRKPAAIGVAAACYDPAPRLGCRIPILPAVAVVAALLAGPPLSTAHEATPAAPPRCSPPPRSGSNRRGSSGSSTTARALTPADVAARFAPDVLAAVPAELVVALSQQLAAGFGPVTFQGYTRPPTPVQANAPVTGAGGAPHVVPIAVEAAPPHRIVRFTAAPVPPPPGVRPAATRSACAAGWPTSSS